MLSPATDTFSSGQKAKEKNEKAKKEEQKRIKIGEKVEEIERENKIRKK